MSEALDLPALLRAELEARGWQQADLERAIGATPGLASRWLKGETSPGPRYVDRIAKVLDMDCLALLRLAGYLDPEPPPAPPTVDPVTLARQRVWTRQFEQLARRAAGPHQAVVEAVIGGWLDALAAIINRIERL